MESVLHPSLVLILHILYTVIRIAVFWRYWRVDISKECCIGPHLGYSASMPQINVLNHSPYFIYHVGGALMNFSQIDRICGYVICGCYRPAAVETQLSDSLTSPNTGPKISGKSFSLY
jgi:hypothetical protein